MNEYDQFEAEMVEAGWSLEEIEAMWQKHQVIPSCVLKDNSHMWEIGH